MADRLKDLRYPQLRDEKTKLKCLRLRGLFNVGAGTGNTAHHALILELLNRFGDRKPHLQPRSALGRNLQPVGSARKSLHPHPGRRIFAEVPGRASYWVGDWKDETFIPLTVEPRRLELFNHLLSPTPQVTGEGQVITMGIIPDQRSPKEYWRWGWAHLYSLPRRLSIGPDGRLQQSKWEGLDSWVRDPVSLTRFKLRENIPDTLRGVSGSCLHLHAMISRETSRVMEVLLRRSSDDREGTVLRYEWEIGRLVLDRTRSNLDPEVRRDVQEVTYFPQRENFLEMEIYLDVSVVEVFLDRRAAFATRIYPTLQQSQGLALRCFGGDATVDFVNISRVSSGSAPDVIPGA